MICDVMFKRIGAAELALKLLVFSQFYIIPFNVSEIAYTKDSACKYASGFHFLLAEYL